MKRGKLTAFGGGLANLNLFKQKEAATTESPKAGNVIKDLTLKNLELKNTVADVENKIKTFEDLITKLTQKVDNNSDSITDNSESVTNNSDSIAANSESVTNNSDSIAANSEDVTKNSDAIQVNSENISKFEGLVADAIKEQNINFEAVTTTLDDMFLYSLEQALENVATVVLVQALMASIDVGSEYYNQILQKSQSKVVVTMQAFAQEQGFLGVVSAIEDLLQPAKMDDNSGLHVDISGASDSGE